MNKQQYKIKFVERMNNEYGRHINGGIDNYDTANGVYNNTPLQDIPFDIRELRWNIVFYSWQLHNLPERKLMFTIYGYADYRQDKL